MSAHRLLLLAAITLAPVLASAQTRGPYLQRGTPSEMTIVWRTAASEASAVCHGSSPSTLTSRTTAAAGTQHVVRITGLAPQTRYFYSVGTFASCPPAAAGNASHYFDTSPPTGSTDAFRVWLLGDSGNGSTAQTNVRNRMLSYVGSNRPDLFVHVGDMAYNSGTTSEFDSRFFGYYQSILQNTPCWPAIGNHEGSASDSASQTGPYYDAYVLPTDGSAGGLPSNTEAYYAFDYGNVHFIALDSFETSRAVNGAMLTWMSMDVAATAQPWIIAFWHHPPYTKGTHDSDTETELVQMRQNALPILEANGVDLVWGGHSHIYERSYLVHGAYDTPTTAPGHIVDSGDGQPAGDGAYIADGSGAVYVVAGHGGASVGGSADHPLMAFSEVDYGSCIVDVDDDTLTLTNVRDDGVLSDGFTMQKPGPLTVLTPSNGAQIEQGTATPITWTTGGPTNVTIAYSANGGASWADIVASTPNDGAYAWTAPLSATTMGLIRVTDASNAMAFDVSGTFAIVPSLPQVSVPYGSTWEYLADTAPPASWQTSTGGWSSGAAELGYGDGDESTVLYDTNPNVPTVYFRRTLVLDRQVTAASVRVRFDDGYAVYVNGTLVASKNIGNGTAHAAYASATSAENEEQTTAINVSMNPFMVGTNVIAVLVKQANATSSDVSFDLELTLTRAPAVQIDECAAGTDDCDANATCTDTSISFSCACNAGYAGNGVMCADIDECGANTDDCAATNATCTNTLGSFVCGCASGYTGNGTTTCTDIDECATGNGGCSEAPLVACVNTQGSSACGPCPSGYAGDGVTCIDIDECATGNGGCSQSPMVVCTNTAGSRTCGACPSGYQGDGVTCANIDDCMPNPCANGGACADGVATFGCMCPIGFTGPTCEVVVSSCADAPCQNGGTCTDLVGGTYACVCPATWHGPNCDADVDECAVAPVPCDPHATCTNTPGAHTCVCDIGYSGSGLTCVPIAIEDAGADGAIDASPGVDASDAVPVNGGGCGCDVGPDSAVSYIRICGLVGLLLLAARRRRSRP